MVENKLDAKYAEFSELIDLLAELTFYRVCARNYKYIFNDQPLDSHKYKKNTVEKLMKSKELLNEPFSTDFLTSDKYLWIGKVQFGYLSRKLNEYMFEHMHLSSGEIARYFEGMTDLEKFLEFDINFKKLFVDLMLQLMGDGKIDKDILDLRMLKSSVARKRAKADCTPIESMAYMARYKAYRIAGEIASVKGLKKIDLKAMYDACNSLDYDILANDGLPQGAAEITMPIYGSETEMAD